MKEQAKAIKFLSEAPNAKMKENYENAFARYLMDKDYKDNNLGEIKTEAKDLLP